MPSLIHAFSRSFEIYTVVDQIPEQSIDIFPVHADSDLCAVNKCNIQADVLLLDYRLLLARRLCSGHKLLLQFWC